MNKNDSLKTKKETLRKLRCKNVALKEPVNEAVQYFG